MRLLLSEQTAAAQLPYPLLDTQGRVFCGVFWGSVA